MIVEGVDIVEVDPAWLGKRKDFEMVIEDKKFAMAAILIQQDPEYFRKQGGKFAPKELTQTVIIHKSNGKKVMATVVINQLEVTGMVPMAGVRVLFKGNGVLNIIEGEELGVLNIIEGEELRDES